MRSNWPSSATSALTSGSNQRRKLFLRVPGDGDGEAKSRDVRPAPFDFVGKAKGFDVEKDFSRDVRKKAGCGCHRVSAGVYCFRAL